MVLSEAELSSVGAVCGVGLRVEVGLLGRGVAVGGVVGVWVTVAVAVGVDVADDVGDGVAVAVGVAVGIGVWLGVAEGCSSAAALLLLLLAVLTDSTWAVEAQPKSKLAVSSKGTTKKGVHQLARSIDLKGIIINVASDYRIPRSEIIAPARPADAFR